MSSIPIFGRCDPDSKFKTVKDVIDEAKRRPGTITLNGGGHGTDDHVAALGIGANNGRSFQMVHFRGTPVAEDIKAGQFRILGVMSAERSPFIPNGPTFREQGFNEVWAVSRGVARRGRTRWCWPPSMKAFSCPILNLRCGSGHRPSANWWQATEVESRIRIRRFLIG